MMYLCKKGGIKTNTNAELLDGKILYECCNLFPLNASMSRHLIFWVIQRHLLLIA